MGCDGGTIPTRDELVRLKKKPEQKDKDAERAAKWKLCSLTQEPLREPIVACQLGRLFNKESLIEFLLDRTKFESAINCDHIKGLKDVKELKLSPNPAFKDGAEKGDGYVDRSVSQYICPITGLEMSGRYKFVYILVCACVLSDRAVREIKTGTCPKDVVMLNGNEEEVDSLRSAMEERRLQAKLAKKSKKKHKLEETAEADGPSSSKVLKMNGTSDSKTTSSQAVGKISSKLAAKSDVKANGKIPKAKSIQDDASASKAYKSLFNTCETAKKQPKGHWVTHNPLFY